MTKIRIELSSGKNIDLELYPEKAPVTVENFLSLVDAKFFDGLCFHRVIPGFMIQGGGFVAKDGGLEHKETEKTIIGEFRANGVNNDLKHVPGVISMARTMAPNSASSQFFICVETVPHLDGQYAGFGKTVDEESLKNAIEISQVATKNWGYYGDVPVTPVVINTIKRI